MDWAACAQCVRGLKVGKRLPDGVYVHVDTLDSLPEALREAVSRAKDLHTSGSPDEFNVVRFAPTGYRLALLSYPGFNEEAFPLLAASLTVDLRARTATLRRYAREANPPVLHRKELLLRDNDPRVPTFASLTREIERHGLLNDAKSIGTRRVWEARLARLGLRVDGHRLVEAGSAPRADDQADVQRHKTALQRYSLSAPMQALWRHGLLQGRTLFDYGSGRGDDLRILTQLGVDAAGWDPHYAPKDAKREADVVNLGYVINVIEDLGERRDALLGAYHLARRVLAVSALIGGRTAYEQNRLFRDGVLTSRNTFQKYFTQHELREYIEDTLGREPIAVAPGLFFIFRDDEEEQRFLAARQSIARCHVVLDRPERGRERRPSRWEEHHNLLEEFWRRCLELGRLPKDDEFTRTPELRGAVGTPKSVLARLENERGGQPLTEARQARMDDLIVYLALNVFERRKSFGKLPASLQRDIVGFWGSYSAATGAATELLFAIAKPAAILAACKAASIKGLGYLEDEHSLTLHSSRMAELPALLRVYVGCAARLYGDVESADLVKIHTTSGKVSVMSYHHFDKEPLPRLLERVKIDMRGQRVEFFDYPDGPDAQMLCHRARYLPPEHPDRDKQACLERELQALGIDTQGFGPSRRALEERLREMGLYLDGFSLRPRSAAPNQTDASNTSNIR